jgi:putative ABC transport system permease protein
MISSDLKIAVRNIFRNKVQSGISILGLGIGLGCIILLMALIIHETSFDSYIPDHKNVYKILLGKSNYTQFPLGEAVKKEFPEVKDFFRFYQTNDIQLRNGKNELVRDQFFAFSDASMYKILGIKFIEGIPANSPSEIAISGKTAIKYFGNSSPVGKILSVKLNDDEFLQLSVSGVYQDFPANSTLFPQFIADIKLSDKIFTRYQKSLGVYGQRIVTFLNWENPNFFTYVVLDKNTDPVALAVKLEKYRELFKDEKTKKLTFYLQPVADTYLRSGGYTGGNEFFRVGNANELKYYWSIAFLILLISITNYIFLTRAATSDRLRELGTRKVLGASPNVLRKQIVLESNLVTILSLIPATFVIDLGMSFINNTLNRTLGNDVFGDPVMWLLLVSVVLFTGTMSGLLIGFNISRIPSLLLLSGKTSETVRSRRWDSSFLIFHFSIYIILVVSVITVTKQIKYSLTNFKGINPENVFICDLSSAGLKSGFTAICDEMEKVPGVRMAAGSSFVPPFNYFLPIVLANPDGEKVRFDGLIMGEKMTELLGIEISEGLSFGLYKQSPMEALFNESAAREYNIKTGDVFLNAFHVRGIVKDFHSHSLHTLIQPMVILQQDPANMGILAIKTDGTNDKAAISKLRDMYNQIAPDEIFEVTYLTDQIKQFYRYEQNQAKIIGAFSFLATVLAVMGLFGIALISIARKTKEIGIRKVNGASISEVLYLLNKGFVRWVIVSLVIGFPVSLYLMTGWQDRFAYKTEISWWIFAVAGISAIIVAVLTVSWQSWRAATRNPVEALRYE